MGILLLWRRRLEDEDFGLRIRDLFAGAYRTRSANYNFSDYADDDFDVAAAEEMLKIIEYVVLEDRSFREVVTADYTFANSKTQELEIYSGDEIFTLGKVV